MKLWALTIWFCHFVKLCFKNWQQSDISILWEGNLKTAPPLAFLLTQNFFETFREQFLGQETPHDPVNSPLLSLFGIRPPSNWISEYEMKPFRSQTINMLPFIWVMQIKSIFEVHKEQVFNVHLKWQEEPGGEGCPKRKRDNVIKLGPIFWTSFSENSLREGRTCRREKSSVWTLYNTGYRFFWRLL